jgi:3-hydroxybutyrate dehydrogenase
MRSLSIMAEREGRDEGDCLADILSAQSFEGLMEPDDMATSYLFLASDAVANITGQALNTDRGELFA